MVQDISGSNKLWIDVEVGVVYKVNINEQLRWVRPEGREGVCKWFKKAWNSGNTNWPYQKTEKFIDRRRMESSESSL